MPQPSTPIPALKSWQVDKFWKRVDKTPGQGPTGTCWEWQGGRFPQGYGRIIINKKQCKTHRVSWLLVKGEDPGDHLVCHTCDNPACCRPRHLFKGTVGDNARDMCRKGRKHIMRGPRPYEHCPRGEAHGRSKLTENDVRVIRKRAAKGDKQRAIAKDFKVAFQTVSKIVNRQKWSHLLHATT